MVKYDLDKTILHTESVTNYKPWKLRHAVEGVQIFGGIGSGKTSGSGRMLALKYLNGGFGGLVLTVKPDEKEAWQEYCKLTGRSQDLIILEPNGSHNFNFLDYISKSSDSNKAITENIVEVLKTVIRASKDGSGTKEDPFWESALDMLLFNVIDLCKLAYGAVSMQQLFDIVQSLPNQNDEKKENDEQAGNIEAFETAYEMAFENVKKSIDAWRETVSIAQLHAYSYNSQYYEEAVLENVPEARILKFVNQFFFKSFKELNDKTRSIVDFMFSGFLFRLLREPIYSLFCRNKSSFTPEDCLQGKIILLNLPVKIYSKVGRDCQILFKYIWQKSMEKRNTRENERPVFLFADEAQNFLHEHDAAYQATARSSRICTVYISQNLPNYYASMGGEQSSNRVKSFLGTLGTKIFHANADIETNKYASDLVGDIYVENNSDTVNYSENFGRSKSKSIILEKALRPESFVSLKTGSKGNNFLVKGIMHVQGDALFNNFNHTSMTFDQNYTI